MNKSEFGDLFNRIMEDMERLEESMPDESKERRHIVRARNELVSMAEWLGFNTITKKEFEDQRKKNPPKPPKLHSVK